MLLVVMRFGDIICLATYQGGVSGTLQIHCGYLLLLGGVVYFEATLVRPLTHGGRLLLIELVLIHAIRYNPGCL